MPIGGAIYQDIYIRNITPDFVMTVTNVQLVCPDGGYKWWPTCAINGCLLDKELTEEQKRAIIPFKVDITKGSGFLCTAGLTSKNILDSGEGPRIEISFTIGGTYPVNGDKTTLAALQKEGFITISTDPWGGALSVYSRPDFCNVTYQIAGSAPRNLPNRLGVYNPNDVCFVVTTDTEKAEIMIKGYVNTNSVQEIAQSTFSGVSRDYKRAVGWVLGTEQATDSPC